MSGWYEIQLNAEYRWGFHPSVWPTPPRKMPRWWQIKVRRLVREIEVIFGPLNDKRLEAYWQQSRLGQSVYEDAGGYMLRCYRAMSGFPVEEPYTYSQAVSDLMEGNNA